MAVRVALGQLRQLDDESALLARQLGVSSIQFNTPRLPEEDGVWRADDLILLRKRCEDAGLTLEAIENVPYRFYDQVMTGGPKQERQLEGLRQTIYNLGSAGISILGYHFMPSFVWRTSLDAIGRGGCRVSAFDIALVGEGNRIDRPQASIDEELTADQLWSNYAIFLEAVLPAAEHAGVKLALHPDDPPVPTIGRSARIFHTPDNFRRAYEMANSSSAWGLDLCLGSVSEMHGGRESVEEMIDWFGSRDRIFYIHMRDVQGTVPSFQECFLGDGNYNPPAILRRLLSHGFDGFILDDHVPTIVNDTTYGHRARAHAIGYIQAMIDTLV